MRGWNASAYPRFPFAVADPSAFEFLTLRTKYDAAGFIAYLNRFEVADANAQRRRPGILPPPGRASTRRAFNLRSLEITDSITGHKSRYDRVVTPRPLQNSKRTSFNRRPISSRTRFSSAESLAMNVTLKRR